MKKSGYRFPNEHRGSDDKRNVPGPGSYDY